MKYHFCYFVLKISLFISSKTGRYDYVDEIITLCSQILVSALLSDNLYCKYKNLMRSAIIVQIGGQK